MDDVIEMLRSFSSLTCMRGAVTWLRANSKDRRMMLIVEQLAFLKEELLTRA